MIDFKKSHQELYERGFIDFEKGEYGSNLVFKEIDFGQAVEDDKIEYRDDGVYYNFNGEWLRGYYFMKNYNTLKWIEEYHDFKYKTPRFHLYNCETMKKKHLFRNQYIWSNADYNFVYCNDREVWLENENLILCKNCKDELIQKPYPLISNSKEFFEDTDQVKIEELIKKNEIIKDDQKNMRGYPFNWRKKAKKFQEKNGLICKSCGISKQDATQKKHFDVDHINGFNKENNKDDNLQVLCVLCHIMKDDYHIQQAVKYPNRNRQLHEFVEDNRQELGERCPRNLAKYDELIKPEI